MANKVEPINNRTAESKWCSKIGVMEEKKGQRRSRCHFLGSCQGDPFSESICGKSSAGKVSIKKIFSDGFRLLLIFISLRLTRPLVLFSIIREFG